MKTYNLPVFKLLLLLIVLMLRFGSGSKYERLKNPPK